MIRGLLKAIEAGLERGRQGGGPFEPERDGKVLADLGVPEKGGAEALTLGALLGRAETLAERTKATLEKLEIDLGEALGGEEDERG